MALVPTVRCSSEDICACFHPSVKNKSHGWCGMGITEGLHELTDCTTVKNTLTCGRYSSGKKSVCIVYVKKEGTVCIVCLSDCFKQCNVLTQPIF